MLFLLSSVWNVLVSVLVYIWIFVLVVVKSLVFYVVVFVFFVRIILWFFSGKNSGRFVSGVICVGCWCLWILIGLCDVGIIGCFF